MKSTKRQEGVPARGRTARAAAKAAPKYAALTGLLKHMGYPVVEEFRFHPSRRWRFDIALPLSKVAFEIDGGVWTQGRHTRGAGWHKDNEKMTEALILGWRVFHTTPSKCMAEIPDILRRLQ